MIPRKLPGPNNTVADAKPVYQAAMQTSAAGAAEALRRAPSASTGLDALVFPTVPKVALAADAESSSVPTFIGVHPEHRSGQQRRHAGPAGPDGRSVPSRKLPIGLELDGPSGSDRRLIAIGLALEPVLGRLPPPAK